MKETETAKTALALIARLTRYLNAPTDEETAKETATACRALADLIDPRHAPRLALGGTFHHTAPDAPLLRLLDVMTANGFISSDTAPDTFIYFCTARGLPKDDNKILWLGTARALGYFVATFFGLTDAATLYKTAINVFDVWKNPQCTPKALQDGTTKVTKAKDGTTTAHNRNFLESLHDDFKEWIKNPQSLADLGTACPSADEVKRNRNRATLARLGMDATAPDAEATTPTAEPLTPSAMLAAELADLKNHLADLGK